MNAYPLPLSVTVVPTGPELGVSVRLATVPVNVAVAVSPVDPVAVTVFDVPLGLNVNPVLAVVTNVQLPPPETGETT